MKGLIGFYRRLDLLQQALWFRVAASILAVAACGAFFGPLISRSYGLEAQRATLLAAVLDPALKEQHAASLRQSGTIEAGGRVYGGPGLAERVDVVLDEAGNLVAPRVFVEALLAAERPAWTPQWLLEQPGTTWLLAGVVTAWLLLIIWMRVAVPFALTVLGTGVPVAACWMLGNEQAMLAFAGIGLLTFTFVLLTRAVLIGLSPSYQPLAVAHTVIKEASRIRLSVVFIVLLLVLLPLLPLGLDPEAPLRFRIQSFISRSLGLTYFIAATMTLVLSCATVAFEIRDRQIWQLMTKPLGRLNYLIGKWLGVVSINLVILVVAGVSTFTFVQYLRAQPVAPGLGGQLDALAVRDEVLTARLGRWPDYDMLSGDQLRLRVDEMVRRDPNLAASKEMSLGVRQQLAEQLQQDYLTGQRWIPPGAARRYRFSGLEAARQHNSTLTLRYRFHILSDDEHQTFPAGFMFNDLSNTRLRRTYTPTMSHMLPVGSSLITEDGTLTVTVANLYQPAPNQRGLGAINFDEDGFELLYRVGSFEGNFFRAMLLTWIKLAFLSMLGICCATFLSFPVACLFSFTIFIAASLGPFLAFSLEEYYPTADRSSFGLVILWLFQSAVRFLAQVMVFALGAFGEHRPTQRLLEGRLIEWMSVLGGFVRLGVIWSGLALGLGYAVIRNRQLAIYSGQG